MYAADEEDHGMVDVAWRGPAAKVRSGGWGCGGVGGPSLKRFRISV